MKLTKEQIKEAMAQNSLAWDKRDLNDMRAGVEKAMKQSWCRDKQPTAPTMLLLIQGLPGLTGLRRTFGNGVAYTRTSLRVNSFGPVAQILNSPLIWFKKNKPKIK